MVIQLDPRRVNTGVASSGRRQARQGDEKIVVPARAHVNHIPEPATLLTLISSAVAAFRKGVVWDRGTILNLLT